VVVVIIIIFIIIIVAISVVIIGDERVVAEWKVVILVGGVDVGAWWIEQSAKFTLNEVLSLVRYHMLTN
jgi:hypothetical protein